LAFNRNNMSNKIHEANRKRWDAAAATWARGADARGLWRRCPAEPELVLCDRELAYLRDIAGKRVCVLGSGDNQVAFALAAMKADVLSVDISQQQLEVAARRATELRLPMSFLRADVTDLSEIGNAVFDVVYTGGHVAVWVSDLAAYYSEAARILRPAGLFVVSEYHPFRRLWHDSPDQLAIEHSYFSRGPFEDNVTADVLYPEPGELKSYEFHWTVSDYINSVLNAGCRLVEVHEFGASVADWEGAPLHGLPEFLLILARRVRPGRRRPGRTSERGWTATGSRAASIDLAPLGTGRRAPG
jgi:SAM-dependent methyltransferase